MAITDYTTYAEVRAVLGVAEEELEDEVLALPLYSTLLDEALYGLAPSAMSSYAAIKSIPDVDRTTSQTRYLNLVGAWSSYQVALTLLGSIALFAPKTIESDKDRQERIVDPYASLRDALPLSAAALAGRILALLAELFPLEPLPTPAQVVNIVVVGLGTDPITG